MQIQPVYEGKLRKIKPGMRKGYKFPINTCPKCGRQVPANWIVQHLKSDCTVPGPRIYESAESD